ncbi:MAG TPA: nucleoside monophosphate kinase [Candidatus Limnocylindrales bacterium]|jgi:adenylate kinase
MPSDNAGSARQVRRLPQMMVVLLGAPGAGKGTQAGILASHLDVPHLASGELLRAAVAAESPLGREVEGYMSRGQLVPDERMVDVFLDRLQAPDAARGAVLDGFPRTRVQAEVLDSALSEHGSQVDVALDIDVPADELVRRLSGRWICSASGHPYHETAHPPRVAGVCDIDGSSLIQRDDDKPATIRDRLAFQMGALNDVIEHYRRRGILHVVDGNRPVEAVTESLLAELGEAA